MGELRATFSTGLEEYGLCHRGHVVAKSLLLHSPPVVQGGLVSEFLESGVPDFIFLYPCRCHRGIARPRLERFGGPLAPKAGDTGGDRRLFLRSGVAVLP